MDNRFYFHHLPLHVVGTTKLLKIFNASVISISLNNSKECIVNLDKDGFEDYGKLSSDIKFYYDSTNNFYYVCLKPNYTDQYISINILSKTNHGYALMDFDNNFDVSELTELTKQNNNLTYKYEKAENYITAETVTEYISLLPRKQYTFQSSLVMISLRNANGTGGNGLYYLTRANTNTIANFELQEVYADSNLSHFDITATDNGFTFTNGANYKYSITEIPNPSM